MGNGLKREYSSKENIDQERLLFATTKLEDICNRLNFKRIICNINSTKLNIFG